MKIKEFLYDKEDGKGPKKRFLLVQSETEKYLEGLDLQDLNSEELDQLKLDLSELEWEFNLAIKELIESYDLNMFKRFLKSKIVP